MASHVVSARSWGRLLVNHNPFYLISAGFVLYGMHVSFTGDVDPGRAWAMMGIYCAYAVMLAMAAWMIIRFGQIWDDARMILLIIVLLFVAVANSLDDVVINDVRQGALHLIVGLAFAVGLTEFILAVLRLRLRVWYRVPYYLQLALLFLYPVGLAQFLDVGRKDLMWAFVLLFPLVVATTLLTLWPAAHLAGRGDRPGRTPWRWPLYPWTLFISMTVGLSLRAASLAFSFDVGDGMKTGFQGYFLIPILLAALVLLLEMGIVTRRRSVQLLTMILPAGLIWLALPGPPGNELQERFLVMTRTLGSPVQLTTFCLTSYYCLAMIRGVKFAEAGLLSCVLLTSVVTPETLSVATLVEPRTVPLILASFYLLATGFVYARTWRFLCAGGLVWVIVSAQTGDLIGKQMLAYYCFHSLYLLALVVGLFLSDALARSIRSRCPATNVIVAVAAAGIYPLVFPWLGAGEQLLLIAALGVLSLAYWHRDRSKDQFIAGTCIVASLLGAMYLQAYQFLNKIDLIRGLAYLAWGVAMFAVALLLSLLKGGLLSFYSALVTRFCEINRHKAERGEVRP